MSWVAVAIGSGAVVGAAASAYAGDKAADASKAGAQDSADTQRYMYDQTREDTAPYRNVGVSALNQLAQLYGMPQQMNPAANDSISTAMPEGLPARPEGEGMIAGMLQQAWDQKYGPQIEQFRQEQREAATPQTPATAAPNFSNFYASPDYKFAFDEGMRGTEQVLAKRGLTGSGAELKALTRFGQGLATQHLGNYTNRLASLAGVGQSATQQLGSLGVATGQGIGAAQQNAADARASSYLNTGAAINNVANTYGQYQLLKAGGYV